MRSAAKTNLRSVSPVLSGDPEALQDRLTALEKAVCQFNMAPGRQIRDTADALLKGIEELFPDSIAAILMTLDDGSTTVFAALQNPAAAILCYSTPLQYSKGNATLALYYPYTHQATEGLTRAIDRLSIFMGLLLENNDTKETLRLSAERYNLSAKVTHDMIWDWDLRTNEIYRHEEGLRSIYGFSDNDPIKAVGDWVERIHPDDKQQVIAHIDQARRQGEHMKYEAEYRFLHGDGRYIHVADRGYITRDAEGNPVRAIGATQDITTRVKALEQVRDSEERYRHIFTNNPLPVWIFDLETYRYLEVNKMAVQHYGYTAAEFEQMTIFDIRPPSERRRLKDIMKKHKDLDQTFMHGRWKQQKKSGDLIYAEIFSHRIVYKDRPAILAVAHDVTQNILLHQQLIKERQRREKEIMKATIAAQEKERNELGKELHDNVNQILTSSKLYLDCVALYDEKVEEYRQACYELINSGIEEIRKLCKSLVPPRLRDVSLIKSIEDILRNMSMARTLEMEFIHERFDEADLDDSLKLTIYRIVQEQTTNILKHADASRVTITLEQNNRQLSVLICDNGKGFARKTFNKGVGFTNIINRASVYHGKAAIKSAPGKGCCLTVTFNRGGQEA